MRIIYPNNKGGLSVLIPAPKFLAQLELEGTEIEKLIHLADKDLPSGTKYELVSDDYVPSDRSFRMAWEYVSGPEEQVSHDLSLDDQLKYNHITQEEYDASNS
jgi:hypothetical protein